MLLLTNCHLLTMEISLINHDILRVRVLNPGEFHFSLPLDVAASGIQALEKLFLYAASSEVKARPSFERPLLKGFQHAQQCQFGHTFEGSFGFTINTPINLPENPQLSLPDQPHLTNDDLTPEKTFERKVTERIIQGLIDIDKALETRDVYAIVDNFEYGLNSKMCTSLIDLSAEKSKEVEFAIEWSPKIKPSIQVLAFSRIILDNIAVDVLKDAAKKLTDIAPFDDTIIGSIVTLHSNEFPFSDEDIPRTAIIKHEIENRIIQVKLELDKKGYETVYKAHGKGETVKATGKLYKKGNTWRMVDITNVDIFDH